MSIENMACEVVTGEFFVEPRVFAPPLTFTPMSETAAERQKCMCTHRAFHNRMATFGTEARRFELRIICRTQAARDNAREVRTQYKSRYTYARMSLTEQRRMFFELRWACSCVPVLVIRPSRLIPTTMLAELSLQNSASDSPSLPEATSIPPGQNDVCATENKTHEMAESNSFKILALSPNKISLPNFQPSAFANALCGLDEKTRTIIINREIVNRIREVIDYPYMERSNGSIILVEIPSWPGHVSISCSMQEAVHSVVDNRKHCQTDARRVTHKIPSPNVQQIMRLVKAELRLQARDLNCTLCGTRHNAWYELDLANAAKTVHRWSSWMRGNPYNTETGRLKEEWWERTKLDVDDHLGAATIAATACGILAAGTWEWWTAFMKS